MIAGVLLALAVPAAGLAAAAAEMARVARLDAAERDDELLGTWRQGLAD